MPHSWYLDSVTSHMSLSLRHASTCPGGSLALFYLLGKANSGLALGTKDRQAGAVALECQDCQEAPPTQEAIISTLGLQLCC